MDGAAADVTRPTWTRPLTPRQNEVCRLLLRGHSEAEIASRFRRSPHTVHNHIKAIYRALHVRSRFELFTRCQGDAHGDAREKAADDADTLPAATILVHVPNLVLQVDRAGIIEFANHVCATVPEQDVVGHSLLRFVPAEQHGVHERALRRVFTTGRREEIESTMIDRHGVRRRYQAVLDPIVERGRVTHCVLTARDVTELPMRQRPARPTRSD